MISGGGFKYLRERQFYRSARSRLINVFIDDTLKIRMRDVAYPSMADRTEIRQGVLIHFRVFSSFEALDTFNHFSAYSPNEMVDKRASSSDKDCLKAATFFSRSAEDFLLVILLRCFAPVGVRVPS